MTNLIIGVSCIIGAYILLSLLALALFMCVTREYRMLKVGERIEHGDEMLLPRCRGWHKINHIVGNINLSTNLIRRAVNK